MKALSFQIGDELSAKPGHDPYDDRPRYRVVKLFANRSITLTYHHQNGSTETVYLEPFMLIFAINTPALSVTGIEHHRDRYRWRNFHQSFVESMTMDDGKAYPDFMKWVSENAPECVKMAESTRKPDPPLFHIEIKIP